MSLSKYLEDLAQFVGYKGFGVTCESELTEAMVDRAMKYADKHGIADFTHIDPKEPKELWIQLDTSGDENIMARDLIRDLNTMIGITAINAFVEGTIDVMIDFVSRSSWMLPAAEGIRLYFAEELSDRKYARIARQIKAIGRKMEEGECRFKIEPKRDFYDSDDEMLVKCDDVVDLEDFLPALKEIPGIACIDLFIKSVWR